MTMWGLRRCSEVGRVVLVLILSNRCAGLVSCPAWGVFRRLSSARWGSRPDALDIFRIRLACLMATSALPFACGW